MYASSQHLIGDEKEMNNGSHYYLTVHEYFDQAEQCLEHEKQMCISLCTD